MGLESPTLAPTPLPEDKKLEENKKDLGNSD